MTGARSEWDASRVQEKFDGHPSNCSRRRSRGIKNLAFSFGALLALTPIEATSADEVNFSFAPAEWQTAIGLPDDPYKSLVDRSGALLYDFGANGHEDEFATRLSVRTATGLIWQKQHLLSPRIPVVRTTSAAAGIGTVEEAFSVNDGGRWDLVHVRMVNKTGLRKSVSPRVIVETTHSLKFDPGRQTILINSRDTVHASLPMALSEQSGTRHGFDLQRLTIPPHGHADFYVRYGIRQAGRLPRLDNAKGAGLEARAEAFWKEVNLPYGRVEVPDKQIQALFDSSIRNIWQAHEIKNGLPSFQVGPTVYRNLWILDGAFLLEAATMVGAGGEARAGIAHELTFQKPNGGIEAMKDMLKRWFAGKPWPTGFGGSVDKFNYSKENGIVLWTLFRHAQLTQDKAWLLTVWPQMTRIAEHLMQLRRETLTNDTPLDDGLIPPGFTDGGQSGFIPEYSNVYWNLAGLHAYIEAAHWLGKPSEASSWQAEYDDFMRAFRRTERRDMKIDAQGNSYLPNRMDGQDLPQRAQWAFLQAVYPAQIFSKDDALVSGNLAMLKTTLREGMIYGAGIDPHGIWTYQGSFYGHALLWQGDGKAAARELYAYANHAAPTMVWREEQSLKGAPFKPTGDMPHNWASAEFIRLTTHLIELDRGTELHLLEGIPAEWLKPKSITRLTGVATPFGALTMSLVVAHNGRTAHLHIEPLSDRSCTEIVVHNPTGGSPTILNPRRANDLVLSLGTGIE
jgi:hypothetical protein